MPDTEQDRAAASSQRDALLSKWDNEEEGMPASRALRSLPSSVELSEVPALTNVELVHLRIRVIALENMILSLLAQASDEQRDLACEMAAYILPRPGFTQHPLTIRAAHQMVELVERAKHYCRSPP